MSFVADADKLAHFVCSLPDFPNQVRKRNPYKHMGGTLTDAILQTGLNYRNVVEPRVQSLIRHFPEASTTNGFITVIDRYGLEKLLNWKHPEKPKRIFGLTMFLSKQKVDNEDTLRCWLENSDNCQLLVDLRGIGPKTIDYLKMLVGISSIAIDRHIRFFVEAAGITQKSYDDVKRVVEFTADILALDKNDFDFAIWSYSSSKGRY